MNSVEFLNKNKGRDFKMAKTVKPKAVKETKVVEEKVIPTPAPVKEEVVQEVPAEETDAPVLPSAVEANVVYSDEFSYTVKAGKGTFPHMSDEDVINFTIAVAGKVEKIEIVREK